MRHTICPSFTGQLGDQSDGLPAALGLPPNRVEQVISKVSALAQEQDANPALVESVYRAMISAFIEAKRKEHSLLNKNRGES